MLIATTSNLSLPSDFCSALSAGISSRHGTHQVAQRLTSRVLPAKAETLVGLPSGPLKSSAIGRGDEAGDMAAT
ncbi:hypothetical protein D9M70_608950 [compost metagenome]